MAEPSGRFVFISVGNGNVARFGVAANGTLSPLSPATVPTGMGPNSIAVSPSGSALFVGNSSDNNISQFAIGAGGSLTSIGTGTVATGMFPVSLAIDPAGRWLYSANGSSSDIGPFSIAGSGALAALNPPRVAIGTANVDIPNWVVVDPSGHYLYLSDGVDPLGSIWQFTIGSNGGLTPMTPPSVPAGDVPVSIAIAAHCQ